MGIFHTLLSCYMPISVNVSTGVLQLTSHAAYPAFQLMSVSKSLLVTLVEILDCEAQATV